ncbi:MAG: GntR family transcriptional regulator [Streptosporangiaceae bacterium]
MPASSSRLGPEQVATLRQLAVSAQTPATVARRARIVLAAAGHPMGTTAGRPASKATAARWICRYEAAGAAGLADRPRSGRPPADRDAALRTLLTAPLLAPTAGWTSGTIAELTGHTQSAVARAWTQAYTRGATGLGDRLPAAGLRLVAAAAGAGNSVLVLAGGSQREPVFSGPFMRSPRRPPLQALAADLLAAGGPATTPPAPDRAGDVALVQAIRRRIGANSPVYVLTRCPLAGPDDSAVGHGQTEVVVGDASAWQGLLEDLVLRCTRSPAPELLAAQHLVMEWARGDRSRFEWAVLGTGPPAGAPPPAADRTAPRASSQALADDVLAVLLDRITSGRLSGGDRVTESFLARSVHASRSHVRDALRSLASSGLVHLEPGRGAVIPTPHVADVVETYAARRALGALVVRRAAHWAPGALTPVERALQDLIETGRTGNAWATGQADLHFQDTLADSTGMRRIPQMFYALTAQLRLFVAVMGLDYTYSIPGMCHDDTTLLDRIRARDEAGAARVWHRKINDAAAYMTTQLSVSSAARVPRPRGGTAKGS